MNVRVVLACGLMIAGVGRGREVLAAAAWAPTAAEILERSAKAYATASSYRDRGIVLTHDSSKPGPDRIDFSTAFERPTGFRFDWSTHHPYPPLRHLVTQSSVWRDAGGTFRLRRSPDGTEKADTLRDLAMGIAGATGVSRSASHHIPRLLMAEISGAAVTELQNPVLVSVAWFEGAECYRITGERPRTGLVELWIGKDDAMIRRIKRTLAGLEVEEIRREIQVGR